MLEIGTYEAKTRLSELLERVEGGEEIAITRHGQTVALLVPPRAAASPEAVRAAIAAWKRTRKNITLGGLSVRELIDKGRR